jgi:hypothetical protein
MEVDWRPAAGEGRSAGWSRPKAGSMPRAQAPEGQSPPPLAAKSSLFNREGETRSFEWSTKGFDLCKNVLLVRKRTSLRRCTKSLNTHVQTASPS